MEWMMMGLEEGLRAVVDKQYFDETVFKTEI